MMTEKDCDPNTSFDELSISINQQDPLSLPVSLKQKQILYCDGKTISFIIVNGSYYKLNLLTGYPAQPDFKNYSYTFYTFNARPT